MGKRLREKLAKQEAELAAEKELLSAASAEKSLSPAFQRERSPFELGDKRKLQAASAKAIIDKATIMDITGGVTNIDGIIQLFLTDDCVIDRAQLADVSTPGINVIVVDEGDESVMTLLLPKVAEPAKIDPQDEKKTSIEKQLSDVKNEATEDREPTVEANEEPQVIDEQEVRDDEEERDEGEYVSGTESEGEDESDGNEEDEKDQTNEDQIAAEEEITTPTQPEREPSEESETYEELIDPSLWEEMPNIKELEEQLEVLNRKRLERIKEFVPDRSEKEKFLEWDKVRLSYRAVDIDVHLGARAGPVGSTIRLTCSASGPPYTTTWLKDRQPLTKNYQILSEDGFHTLVITNAQPEDSGWYTCVFNNKGGKRATSCRARIYGTVDDTPSSPLISLMNDYYNPKYNDLVIEIHVEGNPLPKIKLFKDNDKPIIPNYRTDIFFDGTHVYRLLLNDPVPSDSGVYSCIADNQHGQYCSTHLVNFTGKRNCTLWPGMLHAHKKVLTEEDKEALRIANMERARRRSDADKFQLNEHVKSKLQFTARLNNRTAIEGETVVLFCSVQGLEPITYEWLKDDQPLNWGQTISNETKNKIGKITIINATKADSGVYECKVKNKRGSITTTAYVKVLETPKNEYVLPRFTKPIEEKYNYFRDELMLVIWIRALPLPTLSWYKDGVELQNDEKFEFECEADGSSRLKIRHPKTSDSGVYTCEAVNLAGYSKMFHTLTYRGDVNKPGEYLLW